MRPLGFGAVYRDLTLQGRAAEFKRVDDFFSQLWDHFDTLGSAPELLAVPGNHDVMRPNEKNPSVRLLRLLWEKQPDIQTEFCPVYST